MTWVRVDDSTPHHSKLLRAGPVAAWLWVAALAHANRMATDGVIPPEALAALYPWSGWTRRTLLGLAARLVEVGLWTALDEGGWEIHDYAEYQAPAMREARRARRDAETAKKRVQRERQRTVDPVAPTVHGRGRPPLARVIPLSSRGDTPGDSHGDGTALGGGPPDGSPHHDPSRPAPIRPASPERQTDPRVSPPMGAHARELVEALQTRCASAICLASADDTAVLRALDARVANLSMGRDWHRREWETLADWYAAGAMQWRITPVGIGELARSTSRLAEHVECAVRWHAAGRPSLDRDGATRAQRRLTEASVTDDDYARDLAAEDPITAERRRGLP